MGEQARRRHAAASLPKPKLNRVSPDYCVPRGGGSTPRTHWRGRAILPSIPALAGASWPCSSRKWQKLGAIDRETEASFAGSRLIPRS